MSTTIKLINIFTFLGMRVKMLKIYSLSKFQVYNKVLLTSHHAIHYIPRTYSSYNWQFAPSGQHLPIPASPQLLATTTLLSFSGAYSCSTFNFLRSLHTVFHNGCTNLQSHQQWAGFPFILHPCQYSRLHFLIMR